MSPQVAHDLQLRHQGLEHILVGVGVQCLDGNSGGCLVLFNTCGKKRTWILYSFKFFGKHNTKCKALEHSTIGPSTNLFPNGQPVQNTVRGKSKPIRGLHFYARTNKKQEDSPLTFLSIGNSIEVSYGSR